MIRFISRALLAIPLFFAHFVLGDSCIAVTNAQLLDRVEKALSERARKGQMAADYIDQNPKALAGTINSQEPTMDRLGEFLGGKTASEADYMLKNGSLKPFASGQESQIFTSKANPDEAMKIFRANRSDAEIRNGVNQMVALRYLTKQNQRLGSVLKVAKIKEVGRNYIIKEFVRNAVPVRQVMNDPAVVSKLKILRDELNANNNPLFYNLRQALNRDRGPSSNIMWDPSDQRFFLIDTPGI